MYAGLSMFYRCRALLIIGCTCIYAYNLAIDQGEGLGIQNDRGQQTLVSCKRARRVKYLHGLKRTKLQNTVILMLGT